MIATYSVTAGTAVCGCNGTISSTAACCCNGTGTVVNTDNPYRPLYAADLEDGQWYQIVYEVTGPCCSPGASGAIGPEGRIRLEAPEPFYPRHEARKSVRVAPVVQRKNVSRYLMPTRPRNKERGHAIGHSPRRR